jgi:hypothetical protein
MFIFSSYMNIHSEANNFFPISIPHFFSAKIKAKGKFLELEIDHVLVSIIEEFSCKFNITLFNEKSILGKKRRKFYSIICDLSPTMNLRPLGLSLLDVIFECGPIKLSVIRSFTSIMQWSIMIEFSISPLLIFTWFPMLV